MTIRILMITVIAVFLSQATAYPAKQEDDNQLLVMQAQMAYDVIEMIAQSLQEGGHAEQREPDTQEWDDDDPLEQVVEEEKVNEITAKMLQEFGRQEGGVPQQNSLERQDEEDFKKIENMISAEMGQTNSETEESPSHRGDYNVLLDKIDMVKAEGRGVCLFLEHRQLICNPECGQSLDVEYKDFVYYLTFGCDSDEQRFLGKCYKKCRLLAGPNYPLRTATHTCARNGCDDDQDKDAGLCYRKCKSNYIGVGPVCWGSCKHFCPGHQNVGLFCHRWWPPHSCKRPSYGRGVGRLPYAPKTRLGGLGSGCGGYGVASDGGCARTDISHILPDDYKLC